MSNEQSSPLHCLSLDRASLHAAYAGGYATPSGVVAEVYRRQRELEAGGVDAIWITRLPQEAAADQARAVEARGAGASGALRSLPLYGLPFAVKDNIDCAGLPTTAGCPDYAYVPAEDAPVVARLKAAGAILIGKTNLDQFATGLVGVRSPYGACANAFDPDYVAGGSSCGSAVAVARGLASFALGTDTAGSGRVPAAFNNLVGLKPTRGRLSNRGVIPACRSLDCVSIFALTGRDAAAALAAAEGYDAGDAYSRQMTGNVTWEPGGPFRYGVPRRSQLEFFGDAEYARLFDAAVARLGQLGGTPVDIDLAPFLEAARLLYGGPWVAERLAAIGGFHAERADALHPVLGRILEDARRYTAVDAFRAFHRLEELKRAALPAWTAVDVLLTPTVPTIYTRAAVARDPLALNNNLGIYTNFVNLLDLAAVSVPAGFRADGLPFGVTLVAPAGSDVALCALAERMQRSADLPLGATGLPLPPAEAEPRAQAAPNGHVDVAVAGAHLSGLPLNAQLTARGGRLLRATRTAPRYRLYALPGTTPPKPGLVRVEGAGAAIDVEVWRLPLAAFGAFVAEVPAPLAIGTVALEDGGTVKGFLCEAAALEGAADITRFGGWRRYLAQAAAPAATVNE
ncbi:MAG: allophanate hydrolase [Pseudomonadota bacterium]